MKRPGEAELALLPPDEAGEGMQLKADEAAALEQHEAVIERGITTFYEVGTALLHIRDERLYRETHDTFEAYCKGRWNMGRNYANKVIAAATVMENLGTRVPTATAPVADVLLQPVMEAQVRPLASLSPEDQRTIWARAVEECGGKQPTGASVTAIAKSFADGQQPAVVERRCETGIVVPITITQYSEDEPPPPLSKRDQRRMENERKSRLLGVIRAIDSLNEAADIPPSEVVAHIRTYPPGWEDRHGADNALRNLQMIVKELHQ